ncbi:MAG: CehA/McbA family metallohydrolase [Armatimonadetes bacterium]|nr:CehA/McbA family metallohydrolase [Armatimonadota bacterium]
MDDYLPLDLTPHLNAGPELPPGHPHLGAVTLRGLPFQIGPPDPAADGQRFVAAGGSHTLAPLRIPIGRPARHVIIAHRLLASHILEGGPVGELVAEYVFRTAGGEHAVPVRERFEISVVQVHWGQWPFHAWPDTDDGKPNRREGPWDAVGFRQTEAGQAYAHSYYLWYWTPPDPAEAIEWLEIRAAGPAFLIAAITLGLLDEDPFPRVSGVPVVIATTDGVERRGDLDLQVDRGTATFPYALPAEPVEQYLADPQRGFGQAQNQAATPATAEVAATPSATLTVSHGQEVLGRVRWGEVTAAGQAADDRVVVRLADTGRNWVHTRVVDDDTGQALPCRIHFRTPEGIPYQPHGHPPYANRNLGTWHIDVGGDLRLGQITYAYIDGACQGWLPRGKLIVDVARGYEYEPLRTEVEIQRGQRELELRLKRVRDLNAERYFCGDTHVHFLSTNGAHLEAAGEGLNVVNLLQSQWGHLFTNTEEFTGEPSVRAGQKTIVYAAQENRQHILGHLTLLGQKRPIMPWCSDGPSEAELGGNLETTLSRWADECHRQGGTVVIPHAPNPNGEPAVMIATGRVDALEWCQQDVYMHGQYYRYLNCGYRLPIVGGTDKMTSDVPVGVYRTYVYIPEDEEFTYESWCRNLRQGNTFHSGGPLLQLKVDGQMPGSTVQLAGNGGTVTVEAVATSIFPIHELQIVQQGEVVASVSDAHGTGRLELKEEVRVTGHSWLAARVSGPGYHGGQPHHDGWRRSLMGHTSPVYVAVGGEYALFNMETAQYMLTLIEGGLTHIRNVAKQHPHDREMVTHPHTHEDHQKWLEEPFHEAAEAIHRRMHQMGLAH